MLPAPVPQPPEFRTGQTVPGTSYRVVSRIGQGGMGSVYEVEHGELGKRFVLKALLSELINRDDLVQRLRNEWRALGQLEHPNIVSVTDAGVSSNGVPFYVMERLVGDTLSARLRRGPAFHLTEALSVAADILEGLQAAHEIGVVHRDVKPPNIFLMKTGQAKLLDFGIAKLLDRDVTQLTGRGVAIGTPRYMSPEQASGDAVDGRADLYAVGLVLFEMLSGQGPFEGVRNSEVFFAHLTKQPPMLSTLVGGIPQEVDRFVARMLAKRPIERPASAGIAAAAVRSMLRSYSERNPDTVAGAYSGALTPAVVPTPALPVTPERPIPPPPGAQVSISPAYGAQKMPRITERVQVNGSQVSEWAETNAAPFHDPTAAGHFADPTEASPDVALAPSPGANTPSLAQAAHSQPVPTERLSSDSVPLPPSEFTDVPPTHTAAPLPATPPPVANSSWPPAMLPQQHGAAGQRRLMVRVALAAAVIGATLVGLVLLLLPSQGTESAEAAAGAEASADTVSASSPQSESAKPEQPSVPRVPQATAAPAAETKAQDGNSELASEPAAHTASREQAQAALPPEPVEPARGKQDKTLPSGSESEERTAPEPPPAPKLANPPNRADQPAKDEARAKRPRLPGSGLPGL